MKLIEMSGKKYGRLTVVKRAENTPGGTARWLCKCDCGNETTVVGAYLRNGSVVSCGCYARENVIKRDTKHGKCYSKLYHVWQQMKHRCSKETAQSYCYYGVRGISVCEEWKKSFMAFHDWALSNGYREGLTIDRINNDGNYEPTNCRWVTMAVQSKNKRTKQKRIK